jgi:hypothetical protein
LWFKRSELGQLFREARRTADTTATTISLSPTVTASVERENLVGIDAGRCYVEGNIMNRSKKQVIVQFPVIGVEWKRGFTFMNVSDRTCVFDLCSMVVCHICFWCSDETLWDVVGCRNGHVTRGKTIGMF